MTTTTSHLPYRSGVGIMLLNKRGLVFVAKRIDMTSEAWQMPQGGIDDGESPEVCAKRELEEETGVKDATIIAESKDWLTYDLPSELVPKLWKGQYRGQKQKWYVMLLKGGDELINIHTEEPEFSEWKWAKAHTLPDLIVPFKRDMYQALVDEFKEFVSD